MASVALFDTHTCSHTHKYINSHTLKYQLMSTHTHIVTRSLMSTHTHTHTYHLTHTHSHTHSCEHTHTHSRTHSYQHTHMYTHMHAHDCPSSTFRVPPRPSNTCVRACVRQHVCEGVCEGQLLDTHTQNSLRTSFQTHTHTCNDTHLSLDTEHMTGARRWRALSREPGVGLRTKHVDDFLEFGRHNTPKHAINLQAQNA